jgi:hypothetical protein
VGTSKENAMASPRKQIEPHSGADLLKRPTITPDELFKLDLMPVSRNGIYDACKTGQIECFRLGRKIVIPTAPLRRKLGIEAA